MSNSLVCRLPYMIQCRAPCSAVCRHFATTGIRGDESASTKIETLNVAELLSKPTWSATSLLPSDDQASDAPEVTSKQLHHLLRLSALPPPRNANEEQRMLATLTSQLHFVKEIQKVDTTGVDPLRSLRDETQMGEDESELGLEALKSALEGEEVRGEHHKRIRRKKGHAFSEGAAKDAEWDVLGAANKKVGRFFIVEGGKEG